MWSCRWCQSGSVLHQRFAVGAPIRGLVGQACEAVLACNILNWMIERGRSVLRINL